MAVLEPCQSKNISLEGIETKQQKEVDITLLLQNITQVTLMWLRV